MVNDSILDRLFPKVAYNTYNGHKLAKWLLMFYVFKSLLAGGIHMFASDGGAQTIASVTLDEFTQAGADSVITFLGLFGMEQLIIGIIGLIILWRYKSLIPMMCGIYFLEYTLRGLAHLYTPGLTTAHTPPGATMDYVLIPLAAVMLFLSLKQHK